MWLNFQRLKNKIALSESEDKAAKEKLKEVLPELGKLRTRYLEPIPWSHYKIAELKDDMLFCLRTLEINRLLEEVKRDKAKLEGQCKDLNSDLKNKVTFWREIENENERLGKMKMSTLGFLNLGEGDGRQTDHSEDQETAGTD